MTDKTAPPDRPYVYAFNSARLVLLVCMVLALMLLSLMLGIRIERYQRANKVIAYERVRQESDQPSIEQPRPAPKETIGAVEPAKSDAAPPDSPTPKTPPAQPQPAPAKPPTIPTPKPAPPPKPEVKAAVTTPKVETKKPSPTPPPEEKEVSKGHYAIQVASSQDKSMANEQMEILKKRKFETYIEEIDLGTKGRFFRVMVGPFQTKAEAEEVRGDLIRDSRFSDSYIRYMP